MTARTHTRAIWGLAVASLFAAATSIAQSFEVVHSFSGDDGSDPQAGVVQLENGDFAGTTIGGVGTLFQMNTRGVLGTLYRFKGFDGANPHAPLLPDSNGSLYGTAMNGAAGWGDVFRLDAAGSLTILRAFVPSTSGTDGEGAIPHAPLIALRDGFYPGAHYGVTTRGGMDDLGTIFRLDAAHKLTTFHHFSGWDGALPFESLFEFEGRLYGTTTSGGLAGGGVIFRIEPDGTAFTVMHNFLTADGVSPQAPLIAVNGLLYGTTSLGGRYGMGTIFRIDPSTAHVSVLHHFNGADGANPHAALVLARDGYLYGTTLARGSNDRFSFGNVFRMSWTGTTFEVIQRFNGVNGAFAQSRLIDATDGALYGTTSQGGSHNEGVVFRIVFVPVTDIASSSGPAAGGNKIEIIGSNFQPGARVTLGDKEAELVEGTDSVLVVRSPTLQPGTLSDVLVDNTDRTRGGILKGFFADFLDIPQGDTFHAFVERAVRHRIAAGRGDGTFGRNMPATHAQLAAFLLKAKYGPYFVPPAATGEVFLDVPAGHPFARWIEQLQRDGITDGWKDGAYFFPEAPTTRGEIAPLLLKAEHGSDFVPRPCRGIFGDVPCSNELAPWIEQMFEERITGGCRTEPRAFCPNDLATRGQASVFLTKTFSLN